jgi:hypothetical protein
MNETTKQLPEGREGILSNQRNLPTKKSLGASNDLASLNSLVALLNNPAITGAQVPPEAKDEVKIVLPHPIEQPPPAAPVQTSAPAVPPSSLTETSPSSIVTIPKPRRQVNRIFFTGIIASGKDYVAGQCGAVVLGLADPIYALVNQLFGTSVSANQGKDIPGVREMLQTLGQWGRGDVSLKYPLTPARALMISYVRSLGGLLPAELQVDWASFGANKNLWLDSLVARADLLPANRRVAVTNVRFENEYKLLSSRGWTSFHVMCSPATRTARLNLLKSAPSPTTLNDESEGLAKFLDADVTHKGAKPGGKLRAIWNDSGPKPSPRLYSVNEWLQELAIEDAVVPTTNAVSME